MAIKTFVPPAPIPAFELNARYFASADSTDEQLNDDLGLMLSVVESVVGTVAFEMGISPEDGLAINPQSTAQVLYAAKYLAQFGSGIHAELDRRKRKATAR